VGLILDTSGSMSGKMRLLKLSALKFVRAGNEADDYFVIEFGNRPRLALPQTEDLERVTQEIADMEAGGTTALLDALLLAVREIRHANNPRKALLLISDGLENHSRHTERETKRLLSELDFPIYTINLYERPSGNRYAIQRRAPDILEEISAATGGRSFRVLSDKNVAPAVELIASEIRHEYVLAYAPSNGERDGKFRRVRVQVEPPTGNRARVFHRSGYYAPSQ
jgi:Ca-activated chloride channel homolog